MNERIIVVINKSEVQIINKSVRLFRLRIMKKQKKLIENYQIIEVLQEYEDEYEVILAKHVIQKKYYTLKKISSKNNGSKKLYESLLNQATILKNINHPNVDKCFKMLKTSNNIYLVYNYLEGVTLDLLIQEKYKQITFADKENIIKQLCTVLLELQSQGIAHLNITPEVIQVSEKYSILLKDFIYAMEIPEEGEIQVKLKVPKSDFICHQTKKGIASFSSDVYSFGKILEFMRFQKCKKVVGQDNSKKLKEIEFLISLTTSKERSERMSIQEVYQSLFKKSKKVKRMQSLSLIQSSGVLSSSRSALSVSKSTFGSKKSYMDIQMKILKFRNMSFYLLKIFRTVGTEVNLSTETQIILSILLLKKGTKLLTGIGKYLHYGKNEIGVNIDLKEQRRFFKTSDYFKLSEIMDKEIIAYKKSYEQAVQAIHIQYPKLLKNVAFYNQIKEDAINQDFTLKIIKEYLQKVLENQDVLKSMNQNSACNLYFLSSIIEFHRVQELFNQRILNESLDLQEQIFIKNGRLMEKERLFVAIKQNLKKQIKPIMRLI